MSAGAGCELHGAPGCNVCDKEPGQCSYGSCTDLAVVVYRYDHESREFCYRHATRRQYGFLRRDVRSIARIQEADNA